MDAGKIVEILRATLKPDQREQAEEQLNEVHKIIGFVPTLLQLVMSDQVDIPVRQAGVIYLKNMVCQFWEEKEPAHPTDTIPFSVHEQDRQLIRDNVVEAVIQAPQPIRVQLAVCISHMVKHDYPGKWPGIAEKVAMYLQSDAHDTWMGALICLYQLVKNFEYKKPDDRLPLNQAMQHILPIIYQRCMQLMPDQSEIATLLQKQILKVFFALIQFHLPQDLITKEIFTQWMELVRQIVDKPIPEATLQIDEEDRPELAWWKCKKWALHILARLFERYGSPGNVSKEYSTFSTWYLKSFSGGILQVLLKVLDQYRNKIYVSPRVLQQTLTYLNIGISHAVSWKIVKPHMMAIVQEIIFPLMCHTEEDQELWESDPVEYIRVKYDVFEEFFSPVTAAQTLLHTSVTKRKEVLQKTMGFIMSVLTSNEGAVDPRQKAGALHMVGAVAEILLQKAIYKDQAENMLIRHVFPEFGSEHGYLRARACWVLNHFSEVKFKQANTLEKAVELTRVAMCTDKELPVRVEAAIALQMIMMSQEKAKDILLPNLGTVVLELLKIIRETESDDLTSVMQKIVCIYREEIAPLAVEICTHLADTFAKVVDSTAENSDEKAIVAMGILNTLDTIVTVMEEQKEIVQQIEGVVLNVIAVILQQNVMEFYDELLTLIYSLTSQFVSDRMWNVFPKIYDLFKNDGFDYFADMMPALHNYITVDPDKFLANTRNMEMIYDMCKTIMTGDSGEDAECHAAKLLEILLLQFKGKIDQLVPLFVELALERLTREVRTSELRTMCLQVVVASLYYNPSMLFELLEKIRIPNTTESITAQFLKQWLRDTDCFLGLHDRKMCVLGLCTLLDTAGTRPQVITDIAAQILPSCILLFDGLKRAYQHRAEQDESDSDSETEYEEGELDDEDDVIDEAGQQYLEKLQRSVNGDDGSDDDDDEEDYESEETALECYETPIDKEDTPIDEYQIFRALLTRIEQTDVAWYRLLTGGLTEDQAKDIQEIFKLAEQRHAAMESKKIEQGGGYVFTQTTVPGTFNFGGAAPPH